MSKQDKKSVPTIQVPSIRFKQDDGSDFPDWEERRLGEICNITTGKLDANAMVKNGKYRFFTCSKDFFQTDTYEFDTDALIISGNGNIGYIHHFNGKFNAYQRTYVLDGFTDSIYYIKYFLNKHLYARILREKIGGVTPYIVMSTLTRMKILLPTLPEQQKIASFLESVDKKIQLLERKVVLLQSYKKGVMQKLFSQELRFKDEQGSEYPDWQERRLGEICNITTGKLDANAMVKNGKYRFFTCSKDFFQTDTYEFDTDALIISGNGNIGYIHHFNGKFNAYQRTYVLDGFTDSIYYIKYFLNKHLYARILREKIGGVTPYIVMSTLTRMKMKIQIRSRTEVPKKTSKGVLYPNIFLGVLLIVATIAQRCAGEIQEISVPFLIYLRSNLFACSMLPFCHGQ